MNDWILDKVECDGDGNPTAATIRNGDRLVHLVDVDTGMRAMAQMDPLGRFLAAALGEALRPGLDGKIDVHRKRTTAERAVLASGVAETMSRELITEMQRENRAATVRRRGRASSRKASDE